MKIIILLSLLFLSACNVDLKVETVSEDKLLKEVKNAVDNFGKAYVEADTSKLKTLLAEEYLHINPDGNKISKNDWLNWVGSRKAEIENGSLVIDVYETRDLSIRLISDKTAIADGIIYSTGTRNTELFIVHIKFTNVWIKENGNWKRTVFHDSRLIE